IPLFVLSPPRPRPTPLPPADRAAFGGWQHSRVPNPLELVDSPSSFRGMLNADEIDAAAKRISGVIEPTPLQLSPRLSAATGARVYLKREDLTPVRSYKLRGAYNLVVQLDEHERAAGVVTASAGNHAQGVAFACQAMGIRGRIYVPTTT